MLSQITKFLFFGACATALARPHPETSMSRLSREAWISPATGVRLTQTVNLMWSSLTWTGPHLDDEWDFRWRLGRIKRNRPVRICISELIKHFRTNEANPPWHRSGVPQLPTTSRPGAEVDLDVGANRKLDRRRAHDRGAAIVFGMQFDPTPGLATTSTRSASSST